METSQLDSVAQACMDLSDALKSFTGAPSDKELIIMNHIKKVWHSSNAVDDFKRNLEWVNVSEPISLAYHCLDKVVVLDFWTYCCINCYHVLPDLAHLEKLHSVKEGLVVIGVHSPKFTNEKHSDNVLAAVKRYGIEHPVVNDSENSTWETLGIHCWPTILVLGPANKPIFIFTGEGHRQELIDYVGCAIKYFGSRLSTAALPVTPLHRIMSKADNVLNFPSKIAFNPFYHGRVDEPFLAISDTGNHRVLLTDCTGLIMRTAGGSECGFKDGSLREALFNSPQGLCWLSSNVVVVCDTGNHSIRAIHLDEGTVEVLAGNGKQSAHDDMGGKCLGMQSLSSPWDIVLFCTADMDMSVRPSPLAPLPSNDNTKEETEQKDNEKKDDKRRVLIIACAGSHQIWALFLDTTIWWKYKTYTEGTCVCIAGSGAEAARNSAYPHTASFAQPSGLTLKNAQGMGSELFIADSESSSIRKLALYTGQVTAVCGGDMNPINLFAYGDVDDIGIEAKLQHPLAVAYCEETKTLYIADTYNHKIKKVQMLSHKVTTINPTWIESADPVHFLEPSGLSLTADGKYLYIADTNNHSIKILNLAKHVCQELKVREPEKSFVEPDNLILYKNDLFVNRKCGNLIIYFNVSLDNTSQTKNVKFTPSAPQKWLISIRDESNKDVTFEDFDFVNCSNKGVVLPGRVEVKLKNRTDKNHYRLYLSFKTALCDAAVCFSHTFTVRSTILVRDSVKMVESYKITCKVNPINRTIDKNATENNKDSLEL